MNTPGNTCKEALASSCPEGVSGISWNRRSFLLRSATVDESARSIILAHCLGTRKMDGPRGKAASYRLRSIMERQEGCVPQVFMRRGQKVTQALLATPESLLYFTGDIIGVPDSDRGCRTQIQVRVDGDIGKVWQHWAHGLHRLTCYGDLADDLQRFCRYKDLTLLNEAC